MRWKTSSKTETKTVGNETKRITTTTKTQYITVGDIVGMGKSAAGAVQKLAESLPGFINQLKNINPPEASIAMGVNAVVQPLSIIMEGAEKYKNIMGVIDVVTPIVKTIARSTGVWCSPGNVADLGKIALGTLQQFIIAALTSAILRLKEMIWNYEFNIREISNETSITISKLLKKYNDDHKNDGLDNNLFNKENDKGNNQLTNQDIYNNRLDELKKLIENEYSEEYDNIGPEVGNIIDLIDGDNPFDEKNKGKIDYNLNNYKTEEIVAPNIKRMLYGSLDNNGIYYSDDNGETWSRSEQTDGSFAAFAKIKSGDDWIYLAGSTYKINTVKPTSDIDETICKDIEGHYNKDYYKDDLSKYSKKEKDDLLYDYTFEEIKNKLNDKDDYNNAKGILWSEDGIVWNQSSITSGSYELFFEFQEKDGAPARTVASSYDYGGVIYTEDGKNWQYAKNENGDIINKDRWVFYTDCDNELKNVLDPVPFVHDINISEATIRTINTINPINYNIGIEEKIKSFVGEGFNDIDINLTGSIIEYIHFNYPEKLPNYSEKFWLKKINDIKNGNYTLEDAIAGRGLDPSDE